MGPKELQQNRRDNGINVVDIDTFSIEETFSLGMLYINNLFLNQFCIIQFMISLEQKRAQDIVPHAKEREPE